MAFAVADRVKETSTTTGTGTLNLAGAEPGYQTFVAGIGTGNVTYYAIVNRATSEFEVGVGTVTDAATDTLSRDTVISSSNSDALVDFGAGTKDVICTLPSEKSYVLDNAGDTTISADLSVTSISGSGAGLTTLNASNVSSGTLPNARLDQQLQDVAGLATTGGKYIQGNGSNFVLSAYTLPTADGSANQVLQTNGSGAVSFATISADITGVTAGSGLTGGGTSGDVTLNVGAGTGVTVNADDIAIGQDVATSATPTFAGATFTANVSLSDNDYLRLGTSQDLLIYHSGTGSFISDNGTGDLFVQTNGNVIRLENVGSSLLSGSFNPSGAVELYHNNNKKFETTSSGIQTTGTVSVNGAYTLPTADGSSNQVLQTNGAGVLSFATISADITGVTAGNGLTGGGTSGDVTLNVGAGTGVTVAADTVSIGQDVATSASPTFAGATFTANVSLSDNDYINLGASNDLQIYHDGAASFIKDNGPGSLTLLGGNFRVNNVGNTQQMIAANDGGAAELYYAGSKKLETTTSGVTVTGTLVETSSIDYKENVQPLEFNDAIYNVNAVKYDRKDGSSKDEVGVIAEELYKVLPDLVECKDGKPEAVKYTKMTMYLLEALKKQNQEIQELKSKLN